jgi:hypothetical protein
MIVVVWHCYQPSFSVAEYCYQNGLAFGIERSLMDTSSSVLEILPLLVVSYVVAWALNSRQLKYAGTK